MVAAVGLGLLPGPASARTRHPSLSEALAPLVDGAEAIPFQLGIEVRDLADGRILYRHGAYKLFAPASTLKLVVSTAALHLLGPDRRFTTVLYTDGPVVQGTLRGSLSLRGSGDPGFAAAALEPFAHAVREQGIRWIDGALVLDDGYFHVAPYPAGWMVDDLPWSYGAPVDALSVDENAEGDVAIADPRMRAGADLALALSDAGVHLLGPLRTGTTPAGSVIAASSSSAPVWALVQHMDKVSDNLYAETLLSQLGAGAPDARAAGLAAEEAMLARAGWATGSYRIEDGSGLSRYDEVTPDQLVSLLAYARQLPEFPELFAALPVAGVDGTMGDRLVGTPLAGKLHAKTGTMSGVSSLAGYLDLPGREPARSRPEDELAIAIMIDGYVGSATGSRALEDALVEAVWRAFATSPARTSASRVSSGPMVSKISTAPRVTGRTAPASAG